MLTLLATVAATVLIAVGLVVLPLPIPLGAIMIIIGVGLLVTVNPYARRAITRFRGRNPKVEAVIKRVEHFLPEIFRRPLHETDPSLHLESQEHRGSGETSSAPSARSAHAPGPNGSRAIDFRQRRGDARDRVNARGTPSFELSQV